MRVGAAGSIGLALARNLIGYGQDATATATYSSTQTRASGSATGRTVKIVGGPRDGDIYKYLGTTIAGQTST